MSENGENPIALREQSRLLIFLIADIRGYSKFTHDNGDEAGARLASSFGAVARDVIAGAGGALVELRGDEALAVFGSARQAAHAATELQTRCAGLTERDSTLPMNIGIGLDAGEVVVVEDGYRGRALNVAARLCSLAAPGQILVGEGLVHLAGAIDGLDFVSRGGVPLKGVGTVRVYQVGREGELPGRLPPLASSENDEVILGAMVAAATGAGFGVAGIALDLFLNHLSFGLVVQVVLAGLAITIGLAGIKPSREHATAGSSTFTIAAIGLAITLQLFGALAALLFLIAAGMIFFNRQFGNE